MNMGSVYRKEFSISSFDLNPRGQARLTAMANFFQEMAYLQATELGYGYEDMKDRDTMWVLSRMKISMERYPEWNDRITVETWPSGMEKLFALRDFRVRDEKGDVIGIATTYWLILDIVTHRPVRPNADMKFARVIHNESVFDSPLEKIELPGETEYLDHHRVVFSDLDIIGHVNNVKYMEWCIDIALRHQESNMEIGEMEINFMKEALLGDNIRISGYTTRGGDSYFVADQTSDGREVFRARLIRAENQPGYGENPS